MINIVSIILTRRCNLKCDYCRISGDVDYIIAPREYPGSDYYYNNEKSADYWMKIIDNFVYQNPDTFFILFGGEPFLYDDLYKIVDYMNSCLIKYTIISNCSLRSRMDDLFEKVGFVVGFTASIDPGFWLQCISNNDDENFKSHIGFDYLKYLIKENLVEDPVAEITVDNNNIKYLEETVKILTDEGITSDITVLDIGKNNYYDFSSITDPSNLVKKDLYTKKIFDNIINGNYKVHIKEELLSKIYDILPANLDCKLEDGLDNISIDSDGALRTCLRIRGREVPKFDSYDLKDYKKNWDLIKQAYVQDKQTLCKGCSWTCPIMSKLCNFKIINH
jgi:MoaA/NifB/PqqE/SkfB family radical SAM enzyme